MEELKKLRYEVLNLRNMNEISTNAENKLNALQEAINYTRCYCTFDSLLERLQELNEIKRPYFKWTEQFKKDNRIAWEGKEVELRDLINKLEKELNVL